MAIPNHELETVKRDLSFHLENLKIQHDLVAEHGSLLQRALAALGEGAEEEDMRNRTKVANECATQFRYSTKALTDVSVIIS